MVLLYASMHNDVPVVINLSGRFALERGIDGRLGKDFMQRIKKDGFIDVKDRTGEGLYNFSKCLNLFLIENGINMCTEWSLRLVVMLFTIFLFCGWRLYGTELVFTLFLFRLMFYVGAICFVQSGML